jgi:hypothetical protein
MRSLTLRQLWFVVFGALGCLFAVGLAGVAFFTYLAATGKVPWLVPLLPIVTGGVFGWFAWQAVKRGYDDWDMKPPTTMWRPPPREPK